MEDTFNKLKQQNKNTVDNLVSWMRETGIIKPEATDEKARRLFADAKDKADVDLATFQKALEQHAKEEKTPVAEFTNKLAQQVPKMFEAAGSAVASGVAAARDAFNRATK